MSVIVPSIIGVHSLSTLRIPDPELERARAPGFVIRASPWKPERWVSADVLLLGPKKSEGYILARRFNSHRHLPSPPHPSLYGLVFEIDALGCSDARRIVLGD